MTKESLVLPDMAALAEEGQRIDGEVGAHLRTAGMAERAPGGHEAVQDR